MFGGIPKAFIFIAVLAVAFIGGIFLFPKKVEMPTDGTATSTYKVNMNEQNIKETGGFTIKQIPLDGSGEGAKIPSLDRVLKFNIVVSPEAKNIIEENIFSLTISLKSNSNNSGNWVLLGNYYKMAGDYEGASESWEYAKTLSPNDFVLFNNLSDLYHYYIKDYARAEKNMLIMIELRPDSIYGYRSLYDLYTLSYKEKSDEAPKILLKGLTANPKSVDLMVLLAQYYRGIGDKANAFVYYDKAIAELVKTGDTVKEEVLKAERDAIK